MRVAVYNDANREVYSYTVVRGPNHAVACHVPGREETADVKAALDEALEFLGGGGKGGGLVPRILGPDEKLTEG
jgi:hypothetical protein